MLRLNLWVFRVSLTARNAGLIATQHTFQNSPGAFPSIAWTSLLNRWIPEISKNNTIPYRSPIYTGDKRNRKLVNRFLLFFPFFFFTIEPGNCNSLKETHCNNWASNSKLLQQLHHVGTTLPVRFYNHWSSVSTHFPSFEQQTVDSTTPICYNVPRALIIIEGNCFKILRRCFLLSRVWWGYKTRVTYIGKGAQRA